MRQRSISAVGVVAVGLIPAFMGGPIFATVLTMLCLIGLHEYNRMAERVGNLIPPVGFAILIGFGLAGLLDGDEFALLGVCAAGLIIPLTWAIFRADLDRALIDWTLTSAGLFYLGLPLFAAIALRQTDGSTEKKKKIRKKR